MTPPPDRRSAGEDAEHLSRASRFLARVDRHLPTLAGRAVQLSVSVGAGCYPEAGETADDLLLAATQNMRRNKHARKISHGPSSASVVSIDAYR